MGQGPWFLTNSAEFNEIKDANGSKSGFHSEKSSPKEHVEISQHSPAPLEEGIAGKGKFFKSHQIHVRVALFPDFRNM